MQTWRMTLTPATVFIPTTVEQQQGATTALARPQQSALVDNAHVTRRMRFTRP